MRVITLIINAAVLTFFANTAHGGVWVFGDSTADTGWYKVSPFSGNHKFDFDLQVSSYGIGKPTNNPGPMSVEVLASVFFTHTKPQNQGGTNYATSGAKNTLLNTPLNGGFPNAVPTVTQLSHFIQQHRTTSRDLFVVSSGGNDVGYAVNNLSGAAQTAYIQDQASNLAAAIKTLQLHGAKHIIVANQPESFGTAAVKAARHLYNVSLKSDLDALHVEFAWGDVNAVRQGIVANPATFNILHTSNVAGQIACPQPNAVLNITSAWALLCSAASPVTQPTAFADQALFADDEHWASGAQKILGSYYACLVFWTWPQLVEPLLWFAELPGERWRGPPISCKLLPKPSKPPPLQVN